MGSEVMKNCCVIMYKRIRRSFDIKKLRDDWKSGKLYVEKRGVFEVYKGTDFDDVITLFAKERFWSKDEYRSNQPLMVIKPALEGICNE
jgi:hypothetical protein